MESRHLKDFTIGLVVIVLFAFAIRAYYFIKAEDNIPAESRYKEMALGGDLLAQIEQIEDSIRDRKDFSFTVTRDPLEQNLIVKTKVDLEQEWRRQVEAMMRLAATYIDDQGNSKAAIAFQGKTEVYGVGDVIDNSKITNIENGKLTLVKSGRQTVLELKPIPDKPTKLDTRSNVKEYIW
ncbi:MAG: hypothetical protein WCX83_00545 [Candidatus Cloacimonas sp.]|nr:hypothetical protein [Candidatus Cloacimonadota bacterium]